MEETLMARKTTQKTKNKTNKIAEISDKPTAIYHRLMRYPAFPVKPVQEVVHSTNEGGNVVIITNNTTVEDEEKLFALVHLTQTGKAEIIDAKIIADKADEDDEEDNNLVIVKTSLYQLFKVTGVHDYKRIVKSLVRMSGVLMISDFINPQTGKHEKRYVRPLFKVEVSRDNKLKVYMFRRFLDLCLKKSLMFDLTKLLRLPAIAKNLYFFLYANLDKKTFDIDTIAERTLLRIDTSEKKYTIQNIKRAFDALKKEKIIFDYEVNLKNRKVKVHHSKKALEQEKKNEDENY